jgi:hypothetical protein
MSKTLITTLSVLGGIILLGVILLVSVLGSFNSYTRFENLAKAAQTDNKNILDNTRKSIREAANVSDKEVEALTNIITGYADARGGNTAGEGQLVTVGMVTEAVPSIQGIETLKNLQNIVVAGRKDWQMAQTRLVDIKRQADNMLGTVPSGLILKMFGKKEIEIIIVTSKETEGNFATGEDNSNWVE